MNLVMRGTTTPYAATSLNVRCPACRQMGSFHGVNLNDLHWGNPYKSPSGGNANQSCKLGVRKCPNLECQAVLFWGQQGDERVLYPPEVIDFDATSLPDNIVASLQEAIKCHAAGCYRAAALMIRRVLEEICDDKGLTGKDLQTRLAGISTVAAIPVELVTAANDLRLMGNDAAHIVAKTYDDIGEQEVNIAISLAKELLKAVYQYSALLAQLHAYRKTITP